MNYLSFISDARAVEFLHFRVIYYFDIYEDNLIYYFFYVEKLLSGKDKINNQIMQNYIMQNYIM